MLTDIHHNHHRTIIINISSATAHCEPPFPAEDFSTTLYPWRSSLDPQKFGYSSTTFIRRSFLPALLHPSILTAFTLLGISLLSILFRCLSHSKLVASILLIISGDRYTETLLHCSFLYTLSLSLSLAGAYILRDVFFLKHKSQFIRVKVHVVFTYIRTCLTGIPIEWVPDLFFGDRVTGA